MEQKKSRFNIIDVIAVVLILAVLAFVGWRLLGRSSADPGTVEMVHVTYVVRAEGVPTEMYESSKAHLPSKLMASGALVGGQIESVTMEPFYVLSPDGEWVEDPDHVNLYFTASIDTPDTEVMSTKVGDQEVRIGKKDYILKSEYVEIQGGTIVDVEWER